MTPWTAAHQAPLSIEFFRQDYWSGLSFPPPRDLPDPRIELTSLAASALADIFFFVVFNFLLSFFFFFGRYILYHCATREAQGSLYIIPNLGSELGDPLRAQPDAKTDDCSHNQVGDHQSLGDLDGSQDGDIFEGCKDSCAVDRNIHR